MSNPNDVYRQWREAERRAQQAEHELLKAQVAALAGEAPPPDERQRSHVQRLSEAADALFRMTTAKVGEFVSDMSDAVSRHWPKKPQK